MVTNPRDGDARTSITVTETTTRHFTLSGYITAQVARRKRMNAGDVKDDLVFDIHDAYTIAYEIEQNLGMSDGAIQDKLPEAPRIRVGELIQLSIAAYRAAGFVPKKVWHGGKYPLPG